MQLSAYFDRIGYSGPTAPDFATLDALMRAHAAAVPFENLDAQLGRPVRLDLPSVYAKLVERKRGGWCYEQNGLLGWALGELGFDVRRIAAAVLRVAHGDATLGNHLALIVTLDRPWLVDVGFGGSQAAPLPLAAGDYDHAPLTLSLALEADGYWQFAERYGDGAPFSFDFRIDPADEALLARRCDWLQSAPESNFVLNLIVQQRQDDAHVALRGRLLTERRAGAETRHRIDSADELVDVIRTQFGLEMLEAAGLWDKVCARHAELFPEETAQSVPG